MRALCFMIAALIFTPAYAQSETIVVLAPKTIRPGVPLQLSVSVVSANSVDVKAEIVRDKVTQYTKSQSFATDKSNGTMQLDVPSSLAAGQVALRVTASGGITHSSETQLSVGSKTVSIFIQTDKAMYKPSQTVNFRAIVLSPDMKPYKGTCTIEIKDAQGNKIKLWKDKLLETGMLTDKLELSDQPVLGKWVIKVTMDKGDSKEKEFTIDKYVLPKFEVKVDMPSYLLIGKPQMKATVDSKYTYGKGVEGKLTARIRNSRTLFEWSVNGYLPERTIELKDVTLQDGKADLQLSSAQLVTLSSNQLGFVADDEIIVEVNVTETLTGITRPSEGRVKVYNAAEKIEFLASSPANFKPGLPYTGFVQLSSVDGGVVINPKEVTITAQFTIEIEGTNQGLWWSNRQPTKQEVKTITISIPDSGIEKFSVDVPANTTTIYLTAKYNNMNSVQATKSVSKTNSPSNSYLQLLLVTSKLKSGDDAQFQITATHTTKPMFYQVMARGSLVSQGQAQLDNNRMFSFKVTSQMAPSARVLVYYIGDNKELIADSINFNVEGALQNQVSVSYSKDKAEPGDTVNVEVKADASSLVGLLAVDQSVLLLAQGNDITQADVMSELRSYDDTTQKADSGFSRMMWWFPYAVSGADASSILDNSGVVVLTNALVYRHIEKPFLRPLPSLARLGGGFFSGGDFLMSNGLGNIANMQSASLASLNRLDSFSAVRPPSTIAQPSTTPSEPTRVRTLFPESWLWTNITALSDGRAIVTTTVPDTITSWVASAFAVNSLSGLGVSKDMAKLEVFKSFFVSLNLPYSVVRGEQVILQAIVFNYMDQELDVQVILPKSSEYRTIVVDGDGRTTFVEREENVKVKAPAGKGTTVSFPIIPTKLGLMKVKVTASAGLLAADAVQRELLVEAEGVQQTYNQAVLVDLKNASAFSKTIKVAFPEGLVGDSQRVEFSLIGDLMGPSINGLDSLIRMPYGCGEQNMLNFAPTIFVTRYLEKAGRINSALKAKSIDFMEKGYQRELTYQRSDGSFSAFGQSDPAGSMWLTAFVAKSFQAARAYIYVDEETILKATIWMVGKQSADGSFPEPGRVIHKEMAGGSSSGVSLTAYVLTALCEVKLSAVTVANKVQLAKDKAMSFLEKSVSSISDPYSLALISYALQLSMSSKTAETLANLEKLAKNEGGITYWTQPQPEPAKNDLVWRPPHTQSKAINIELAAYALMAYSESSLGVTKGLPILKWITGQRNADGGFSSTQDTVVALQGLTMFASLYSSSTNMKVNVIAGSISYSYTVDGGNSLVLQATKLPSDVASVRIVASGTGIALAQVAVTYNIENYEQEPAFDTSAVLVVEENNRITVKVCTRWLLPGSAGMTVKEIGIPTGFSADIEGLELKKYPGVKRIEQADRKVIIYYEEIGSMASCVEVDAERSGLVAKARPVAVKVYDYYEPENQQTIFYSSGTLDNVNVCEVCGTSCEGCAEFFRRR